MTIKSDIEAQIVQIRKLVRDLNWHCAEMRYPALRSGPAKNFFTPHVYGIMEQVARNALMIATLMIHQRREGHLASAASALYIVTAIYFSRAMDWISYGESESGELLYQLESHKPHAVPDWHGLLYLEGFLGKEQIQAFRTVSGPNAYPTHEDAGI